MRWSDPPAASHRPSGCQARPFSDPGYGYAPGVRTGMHLRDAQGPVATRAREPAAVGREGERRDPSVDLPELLESAVGREELPGVARRASTRTGFHTLTA